jgi:hypothetical protein
MKKLFAAVLVFVFVLSLAGAAPAGQAKQPWKAYVYPDDGFRLLLPSQPDIQNDGGDTHIHVYTIRLEGGGVFSLRAVRRLTDCETTLADLWDKAESNKDPGQPVVKGSLKQVSLAGLRGLEYETARAGSLDMHRFHCGNKIFYIFSAGYKGKRPADLDRIINSFQTVNPAH